MSTKALTRNGGETLPPLFDDFFRPWNEWFDKGGTAGRTMNVPAVNITENKDDFKVSLAVPGMKKDDFRRDRPMPRSRTADKTPVTLWRARHGQGRPLYDLLSGKRAAPVQGHLQLGPDT